MARNECSAIVMNTSIGSDGERSECGSPDSVSPSATPASLMEKRYDSLMASAAAAASRKFAQNLKFSIENILRPDFGHQTNSSSKLQCNASISRPASSSTGSNASSSGSSSNVQNPNMLWPAWVYCTRYSDRPSSGPRCRRVKRKAKAEEKRPRTAFTAEQLARLKKEFQENRYLTEKRRNELANELGLNESQIKIWFQNKRAKIKKQSGNRNALAYHLLAQGLYNHATVPVISRSPSTDDEDMKLDDDDLDDDDDELTN